MNHTFCPLPWSHLATKANGDLRICCQANQGPNKGLLKDDRGVVYNLNRNRMHDARNAKLVKEIRVSMLKGEQHPECRRCWDEEIFKIRSKRLQTLEYYNNYEQAIKITAEDGSIPQDTPYVDFDLRFGNLCNLKCRMCAPTDSSMWYDDYTAMTGKVFDDTGFDWYKKEDVWRDLESQIPMTERFYIIGGEPTLIQKHFDFLELCVEKGYAKDIYLEYATNVTNIHQKYIDIWKNFKGIHIGCSVDGVGRVNDYVRFPSKWKMIEKNLEKLSIFESIKPWPLSQESQNINVVLATTVNAYNIYYLDDLIKWNMQNHNFVISLHPLYRPGHLNAKVLPLKAKEAIAAKLRSSYDWIEQNEPNLPEKRFYKSARKMIRDVEGFIDYMMSEDMSSLLPKFWDETTKLDELRGESIEDSLPELFDLIKDTEFNAMHEE